MLPGRLHCFVHDPDLAAERAEARRRGAVEANRLRKIDGRRSRLDTVDAIKRHNADLFHGAVSGEYEPAVVNAAGARLDAQERFIKTGELERRLAALEASVPARNGGQRWRA